MRGASGASSMPAASLGSSNDEPHEKPEYCTGAASISATRSLSASSASRRAASAASAAILASSSAFRFASAFALLRSCAASPSR